MYAWCGTDQGNWLQIRRLSRTPTLTKIAFARYSSPLHPPNHGHTLNWTRCGGRPSWIYSPEDVQEIPSLGNKLNINSAAIRKRTLLPPPSGEWHLPKDVFSVKSDDCDAGFYQMCVAGCKRMWFIDPTRPKIHKKTPNTSISTTNYPSHVCNERTTEDNNVEPHSGGGDPLVMWRQHLFAIHPNTFPASTRDNSAFSTKYPEMGLMCKNIYVSI